MKTSPRPKARPTAIGGRAMTKSPRPKSPDAARADFMLKRQVRSGDGYAKGGMVKGGKCPKCGKSAPCMACGGMAKKGKK